RDLAELAYERGADLCLFKPIRRMDLLSAALWKRKDSGSPTDSQELVVQRSLARRKVSEPLRILVVEDNSLMRNLTVRQLDKFGLVADVAANGAEAVEMTFANDYSLLLMDCQMPVMDGFEATLEIRKRESLKGGHVPIVAMTAYAMSGDREQCIASGMDDYLSKPVTMDQLERMLEKWLQDVTPPTLQIAGAPPRRPMDGKTKDTNPELKSDANSDPDESELVDAPIDIRAVTRHYGEGSLHEILASFAEELQELVPAIALEVKRGDADTVAKLAHQLKGLVSVLSADEISETAVRLEQACRNGKVKEIEAQTEKLVNSKNGLISFINNFLLSE
ncbi:MAG: response regulator, partial [Candidatus Obscuribacterales bacterium]|nr:response regulator [Candidatus Obscuribacterales bacterium]